MKHKIIFSLCMVLIASVLSTCDRKPKLSRDEIPSIKTSIYALEQVLKARNTAYLDSILSSEARQIGTTPETVLDFIYGNGPEEFTGFTGKQIMFRGDAARVDCNINGLDSTLRPVTITLRREEGVWLVKRIEKRTEQALPDKGDSL